MLPKVYVPPQCYRSYEFLGCLTMGELEKAWFNGSRHDRAIKPPIQEYGDGRVKTAYPYPPAYDTSIRDNEPSFNQSGRGGYKD